MTVLPVDRVTRRKMILFARKRTAFGTLKISHKLQLYVCHILCTALDIVIDTTRMRFHWSLRSPMASESANSRLIHALTGFMREPVPGKTDIHCS